MSVEACRSCRAPVIWRAHAVTGKPAPLDAEPNPRGSCVLVGEGLYAVIGPPEQEEELIPRERFMPHFATCPNAEAWRR